MKFILFLFLAILGCSDRTSEPITIDDIDDTGIDSAKTDATSNNVEGWQKLDGDRCDALQAKLDQAVVDLALPGAAMGVAFHKEREVWSGASGLADIASNDPWTTDRLFRIGSVTKTFTAAAIYLLIEEGVVSLDDPLEQWVPGYYDGVGVELEHLITNTSGIASYNYVGSFDDTRPWTPVSLVEWAVANEPALGFEPGTQWEYSNTNYVLLGLVIEAATGLSYSEFLQTRFFDPLALTETYVAQSGDDNPRLVSSYDEIGNALNPDPSFGWAAGAIVSTPSDLARWGASLFGGDVITPTSLETMLTPVEVSGDTEYAHGVFVEIGEGEELYGHTGGIGGFLTYMYFYRNDDISLVVVSNQLEVNLRTLSAYGWGVVLGFEYP